MILYDMKSSVNWVRGGEMSVEQMKGMPEYKELFSTTCVLYDDGVGGVYSFEPLADAAARWCVPQVGGADAVFAELKARMDGTYKAPGVAEAQATADEAKAMADTSAASMNEYMDALLGLNTTNGTEAADAE